mmetsp:Transcript_67779/g.93865  ORF Transcript_67779/g.93865 Transcript_67779/m.93865 type:complete len:115 (-) Transcript_67779:385-729(-)|eukprot:CAMPEP_0176376670 /NCGR_PEP_ID=MMETSP0126-20121128/28360_1 /TAXON_ID=141414 ORGANISM="Strombidinopsis acuminatum, Strain SPMC142" /NCGR_SAMPLE_ID=MMETSP0126 /ASSEMBLY_ACC=CAM_ASM_000229 /LENGTH=114 /DNA_ID=CAMNT_0017738219 /DNA_START=1004 /DNA_END=1348 /DNA_ORIENTATION=-
MKSYAKLAIPGALLYFLEIGVYELNVLLAGYIGVAEQAAMSLMVTYYSTLFMVAYGLSLALCVLVGNAIGAGNVDLAKRSAKLTLLLGSIPLAIIVFINLVFKDYVAYLFTNDI